MANVGLFFREHWLLAVSVVAALASMALVPPDGAYLGYFDWRTLGCLFCVLAVASAFRLMGAFDFVARAVVARFSRVTPMAIALVLVTAAVSMVATNDVALIVMLPLSAAILVRAGWVALLPVMFSLQALAANLCGMITPFGNPQNVYLYSYYRLGLSEFLGVMGLPFAVSLVGIGGATVLAARRFRAVQRTRGSRGGAVGMPALSVPLRLSRRRLVLYGVLLVLAVLAVLRLVPVGAAAAVVTLGLAVADRRALAAVDWSLLATFVCFFVFAGNLARVPVLVETLSALMEQSGLLVAVGASQIISNVPAAVLLSHFTATWQPLLVGVNIGGAGTFVGSLASLIAIQHFVSARKIYPALRAEDAPTTAVFLGKFAVLNFAFLAVLVLVCSMGG